MEEVTPGRDSVQSESLRACVCLHFHGYSRVVAAVAKVVTKAGPGSSGGWVTRVLQLRLRKDRHKSRSHYGAKPHTTNK